MNNNLNFNLKNTINTNPNQTNENTQRDYPKFPVMDKVPISFGNRYNNIENNYLDNTNESINATLNKYIVPKNYNKKVNNENNIKSFQNLSNEDKLATLNKYTIPSKNIYSNK